MNEITIIYIATTLLTILGAARLVATEYRALVRGLPRNRATLANRAKPGTSRRSTTSSRTNGRV